jgi:hypothetical protein
MTHKQRMDRIGAETIGVLLENYKDQDEIPTAGVKYAAMLRHPPGYVCEQFLKRLADVERDAEKMELEEMMFWVGLVRVCARKNSGRCPRADCGAPCSRTSTGEVTMPTDRLATVIAEIMRRAIVKNELESRTDGLQQIFVMLKRFGDVLEGMGEDGSDFYRAARCTELRLKDGGEGGR